VVQQTSSEVVIFTAVANARFLYKKIGKRDISVTKFREEILKALLNDENV
jgi:hypothetical protein